MESNANQQKQKRGSANQHQPNGSSFVTGASNQMQTPSGGPAAANNQNNSNGSSGNMVSQRSQQNPMGTNFQVRKSYIQPGRNSNTNAVATNAQVSRTNTNRVSLAASNGQLNSEGYNIIRSSGMPVSKTRNSNEIRTKQLGGVGLTLTQKINATLETEGLPGVPAQQSEGPLNHQKLSAGNQKGRSESRPSATGTISLPKPISNGGNVGNSGGGASDLRTSQMLSDRNTLNPLSHQDGGNKQSVRSGAQFATITGNRAKPQYNAKNNIEPMNSSKAPPQMQNVDMSAAAPQTKPRGYGSTRNHPNGNEMRALVDSHHLTQPLNVGKSMTQNQILNVPSLPAHGNSIGATNTLAGHPAQSAYASTTTKVGQSTRHQQQIAAHGSLSLTKHQSSLGANQLERRSLDQNGLIAAKDYYNRTQGTERQSSTNIVGNLPQPFSTKNGSGANPLSSGGLSQKKTVSSRTGLRRNQYNGKAATGNGGSNWTVVNEEVPYPPNTSSNQMKNAVALNQSGSNNQSMSLTRNTSQIRSSNLMVGEENMKHTNSQTIHVEKGEAGRNSNNKHKDKLSAINEKTPSKSHLKDFQSQQSPDAVGQHGQLRKVRMQSAQRKKQLQGMARNKVMLEYNSHSQQTQKQGGGAEMSLEAAAHNLVGHSHVKKQTSRMNRVSDLLVGGPQGVSHTLQLDGAHTTKNKEDTLTASQFKMPVNSVKNQTHTQNSLGQSHRIVSGRKSQQMREIGGDRDDGSVSRSQVPGGFNSVAGRIALIAKKQGTGGQRISSQEPPHLDSKKQAMISAYAKTSSGLRAGSFRNHNGHNFATEQRATEENSIIARNHKTTTAIGSHSNNFIVSPRAANTAQQIGQDKNRTLDNNDTISGQKQALRPQNSSKLIKSAQGNPFAISPLQKDSSKLVNDELARAEQLRSGAQSSTSHHINETSIVKNRPTKQPKVSQPNLAASQATKTESKESSSNQNATASIKRYFTGLTPSQSANTTGVSAQQNQAEGPPQTSQGNPLLSRGGETNQSSESKKQFEMLPSTGGSDEALPKPYQSNTAAGRHPSTTSPALSADSSQHQASSNAAQSPEQLFNVNYQVPDPVLNPLKDFEPAKFASKTHGLITSYAANTHQGIQRNYNEDRVSIILNMTRPSTRKDVSVWPKCSYFAIYDGHGGSDCSDFLKDQLHLIIINQPSFPKDPAQALTTGCLEAERRFIEQADRKQPMHERSGSCGVVVLIVGKECFVANVGDSRAIMSADKGKKLFLLSRDHRPNEEYEVQRIVKNGGGIYQTQSIQQVQVPGQDQPQQHFVLGPHRVIPGRLSVSRTFGDIEAKHPKYGGKEGVIIAQPEISQFTVRQDFHDFIVLGCDGIFDRLSNQQVLDTCWDTINSIKSNEIKQGLLTPKTVHQVSGAMADAIIKQAAIERSLDNLTIVIVTFENLNSFIQDRPKPTLLENHLFQIKEVESGATSTLIQQTPGLSDSHITGQKQQQKLISGSQNIALENQLLPSKKPTGSIAGELAAEADSEPKDGKDVRLPSRHATERFSTSFEKKDKRRSGCRTTNQASEEKDAAAKDIMSQQHFEGGVYTSKTMDEKPISSKNGRRNHSQKPDQPFLKQASRNSERPLESTPSQRRKADILPKLPQANSFEPDAGTNMMSRNMHGASSLIQSPNSSSLKASADLGMAPMLQNKLSAAQNTQENSSDMRSRSKSGYQHRFMKPSNQSQP